MTIVWPGTVGSSYTNDGGTILYQLHCSLVNTCGLCYQYHLSIAKWWGKLHRGCNCTSVPIYPGKTSAPYEDWRRMIADLDPAQQAKVVGVANLRLIESGVVKWEDVVTSNRVRLLREVVSREKLTVDAMVKAGVKERWAQQAHATVNTPAHQLAARQRDELLRQIQALGIRPKHLKEMFGEKMAARIGIGAGPSKASAMPAPSRSEAGWVRLLQRSLRPVATTPGPKAAAEKELGVTFAPDPAARDNPEYTTVVIDVARVDADLALDPDKYVAPGGTGAAIAGRYEAFVAFLAKARESGKSIEQPRMTLGDDDVISIPDGRHRFAVLRDEGATSLPVTVHKGEAAKLRKKYGAKPIP